VDICLLRKENAFDRLDRRQTADSRTMSCRDYSDSGSSDVSC